jgi:hypothetical protein
MQAVRRSRRRGWRNTFANFVCSLLAPLSVILIISSQEAIVLSLGNTATDLTIPEGMSSTTMKNRTVRVAAEVGIPVTIRRVSGGLPVWRSTNEDLPQAAEVHGRLQSTRQPPHTTSWDLTERIAYLCGIGRQRWNPLLSKCCDGMS